MLGYPDDWTRAVSRTARLRVLGNSVQVQVGAVVGAYLFDLVKGGCMT